MSRPVCPKCGSVAVQRAPGATTCLRCGHSARKFPSSTDPGPSPTDQHGDREIVGPGGYRRRPTTEDEG